MCDRQVTTSSAARALQRQRATATSRAYPLYWRMLRLHHVRPNGWQRAILVEGGTAVAVPLGLAEVASAWTLFVLPVTAALLVKAHDLVAGWLPSRRPVEALPPPRLADYGLAAGAAGALGAGWGVWG